MGKTTGFLENSRKMAQRRPARLRVLDYKEIYLERSAEVALEQGGRCMDCGVPFCQQGCPLGNLIPDWNDLVYRGHWREAWHALSSTNDFPEFTGRLCPAPCEGACVLGINDDAVTIEQIEKEIVERAFREGWVTPLAPAAPTGKHVAVVGSGPCGLATARQLRRAGHDVTVYERDDRPGGLLRYGIPDFKLEKWVIDRRLDIMTAEGVRFETGADVGKRPTWDDLSASHDAVVVTIGALQARDLQIPGRELPGVHLAMSYLGQQNRRVSGELVHEDPIDASGKRVVILGGGDTGSDCLGTAHRQGAASVQQIELMPAPGVDRDADNPWPQWPIILRTSSSQEEGGERRFGLLTKRLSGNGKLERLHTVSVSVEPGQHGRNRLVEDPASESTISADLLILALGFTGPAAASLVEQTGVKLSGRGNVEVDEQFRTSIPGLYAAGDARRGASLIVWAISDGREAARWVDADLRSRPPRLPTRGRDRPFGGR